MSYIKVTAILVLLLFLATPVQAANQGAVDDIAKEIMCQCGCTMIVYNCDCGTADDTRALIGQKLDGSDGNPPMTKQQILDYFVEQYGETVLAAPTKEGFNITAWIMPFVGIAVGIGIVYFVLNRWLLTSRKEPHVVTVESEAELDEYEERFKRELDQFEGRS